MSASLARLVGVHGQWMPPEDDFPADIEDYREVFVGRMRIVHRQRARKLRRRGEPVVEFGTDRMGRKLLVWFVEVIGANDGGREDGGRSRA